jgi:hypothetical protein
MLVSCELVMTSKQVHWLDLHLHLLPDFQLRLQGG